MKKRIFSMLLVVCMVFTLFPTSAFATGNVSIGTSSVVDSKTPAVCENHKEHDETCGYMEAVEGAPCDHLNEDGSYSCAPVLDSDVSGNSATPSDADKGYVCDHTDGCGYTEAAEGADCTHECELCKPTDGELPAPPEVPECDCTVKCVAADPDNEVEAAINADCPLCGAENADLAACEGEAPDANEKPMPLSLKSAESRTCTITAYNKTDFAWDKLYMSPANSTDWGDVRNAGKVGQNSSLKVALTLQPGDTAADMKIVDGSGTEYEISGIDIGAATSCMLDVTGSSGSYSATVSNQKGPVTLLVDSAAANDDALRAENATYKTLDGAVAKADSGDTIKLSTDITGKMNIPSNAYSFTLDLNGKTLNGGDDTTAIAHNGTGTLIIKDSASGGKVTSNAVNYQTNTISLTNGSAGQETLSIIGGTVESTGQGTAISNRAGGTVNVSGGTVNGGSAAILNAGTGEITVTGGEVNGNTGNAIFNQDSGLITISGTAKVTSANTSTDSGTIELYGEAAGNEVLKLTGGTVENTSNNGVAIYNNGQGKISISGGKVTSMDPGETKGTIYLKDGTTGEEILSVAGGTVSANESPAIYNASTGLITISGTQITSSQATGLAGTIYLADGSAGSTVLTVTGGTVKNTNDSPGGAGIYNKGAGTVEVKGGEVSATGGAAGTIHNASTGKITVTGGTVSNTTSFAIYNFSTGQITIGGDGLVTSENQYGTIYLTEGTADYTVLTVTGGTVTNTASPDGSDDSKGGIAIFNEGSGKIAIKGGTVTSRCITDDKGTIFLAAGSLELSGGEVVGDGSSGGLSTAIYTQDTGTVTMKSGTYTIRGNGKAMNKAPTVDSGVTLTASTDVGGTPTVTYNAADIANYKYLKAEPGISAKITNTLNFTESTDTQDCTNTESHGHFHPNHTHADGSKCWSWNKDSRTLTLNNVDIEVENGRGNGINLPGDSKIEFTGVNTIKGGRKGISGSGSLEISGSGSLNVMGGEEPEGAEGIEADTLTLSGENANYTVTKGKSSNGYAINAAATLQCGMVTAKCSDGLLSLFLKEPILHGMIHKADTGTWDNHEKDCIYTSFTDADAVAVAKKAIVNGTVEVANGADQAAKTAAVQAYVDSLIAAVPNAAGVTAAVRFISGNGYSVALSKNSVNDSMTITVTVNELPAETHTVTYTLTSLIATGQPASVADGGTLNATLTAASGYTLPDSITVTMDGNGSPTYIYTKETGAVEVSNVTGNVVITASGTPVQGSVDTSSIDTAIAAANAAKKDIAVNDNPASSVTNGTKFVTTAEMKALTDAIAAATAAKSTVISTAEAQAAAGVLNSAVTTFKAAIKTGTYTSGGSGGSGGSSSGGGGSSSGSSSGSSITVTPPPADKPNLPTQGEIKVSATVDGGSAAITITEKNITDAYNQALADAKKNGNEANGITLVLNVNTGNKTVSSATVNLPKTAQETIISKQIVSTVVVIDSPGIKIGMDLNTIKEINKQANADVNITAVRKDNSKLTGNAKTVIGNRPVFDLSVTYGNGKTVNNFGGGSVSITLPYTLQAGEKAGNACAVYVDTNGNVNYIVASSYDVVSKSVLFSTNHFSIYGVGYKTDVPAFADIADHWAKTDIEFVAARGLLAGTSTTTFSPNTSMTRGMFVTALGRLANADVSSYKQSSFTDVKADAYYMGYVEWATKNNIVNGIGGGKFAPDQAISREQTAVIIANYAKVIGFNLPKVHAANTFADGATISSWATDAVKTVQMAGILAGKNGNIFDPQGTATRAEVSAVLHRFVELRISTDTMQGWTINDSGKWMYYENGKPVTGKKDIDGTTYTFDQYGVAADVP